MYPESEPQDEQVEVQDTQIEQQVQPDPPSMKLWKGLKKMDLYSKDYNNFVKQYSDPAEITRLHKGLVERELYSNKDESAFVDQYFPELKKKDQAQVVPPSGVGSQVGASQLESTTPTVAQETPRAEEPLYKELPEVKTYFPGNVFDIASEYNSLKNAKKTVDVTVYDPMMGDVTTSAEEPDQDKISQAEELKKKVEKDYGIKDLDKLYKETEGLTENDFGKVDKNVLIQTRKYNNPLYQRQIANLKWSSNLEKTLSNLLTEGNIDSNTYNIIENGIKSSLKNANVGDFDQQRANVNYIADVAKNFGGTERENILRNLGIELAKVYGNSYANGLDQSYSKSSLNQFLDKDSYLGYSYLKDMNPEAAKQYERLFGDNSNLTPEERKGADKMMQVLKETGIGLQANAVNEELNPLIKKSKEQGGLNEEDYARAKALEQKQAELAAANDDLDNQYPDRLRKKIDEAIQDVAGERFNTFQYIGGKLGEAFYNTGAGIWEAVSNPFMDSESVRKRELALMGEESPYYTRKGHRGLETERLVIEPELQKQIDEILADKTLNESQKYSKLYATFYENKDKFENVPIEGGELNISPSTIGRSLVDLTTTLAPFFAVEYLTGGVGGAGAAARFLRTFNAAATTGFHDVYEQAVKSGKPQDEAFKYALSVTAINSAAMAGAGTYDDIRKMLGNKISAGKVIGKLTDAEIKSAIDNAPSVLKNLKNRIASIPATAVESLKGAGKFEAAMALGEETKSALGNEPIDRESRFKQSLINFIAFPIMGIATGQLGYKTPTELQKSSVLQAASDPTTYLLEAEKMRQTGELSADKFAQVKANIERASKVYNKLGFVDANGNKLKEKDQHELLNLKIQEDFLNDEIKKDLPEPVMKRLGEQILDIKGKVNDIYEGNLVEKEPTATSVVVGGDLQKGDNIISKDGRVGKIVEINEKGDAIIIDEKDNLRYRIKAEDIYRETAEETSAREAEQKPSEEKVTTTEEVKPTGEEVTTTVEMTPEEKNIEDRRAAAIKEFEANPNLIGIEGKEELITPQGTISRETINAEFDKEKEALKPTETAPPTETGRSAKVQQLRQRMGLGEATGPKKYTMATIKALDTSKYKGNAKEVAEGVKNMMKAVAKLVSKSTGEKLNISLHDNPESYRKAGGFSSKGFYFGKDGSIHLNMSAVTKDTGAHEFFHPVLDYMAMKRPDIIKNLHDQLKKLDQGAKIINQSELRYKDKSVETQQKEAITDYIAQVASGQIKLDRTNWEAIRDFIITALDKVGLNLSKDINSITDLQKLAKQIDRQFKSGQELRGEDLRKQSTIKPEVATGAEFSREDRLNEMAKDDVTKRVIPGKTVSTRLTDAEDIHSNDANFVSLEEQRKAPANYLKNARIIAEYDMIAADKKTLKLLENGIKATLKGGNKATLDKAMLKADEVYNDFIRKAADNLVWLHNHYSPEIRDIAKRWYDGANIISQDFAKQHGLTTEQVAGVIAVLSPKKDWYTNVDNAKRIMDIYKNHLNFVITREMADKYIEIEGVVPPKKKTQTPEEYELVKQKYKAKQERAAIRVEKFIGKKISDPKIRSFMPEMIRTYDETYGDKNFDILSPNGKSLGSARNNPTKAQLKKDPNAQGDFTKTSWAGYTAIGKAIRILENGQLENISKQLGEAHKVRNFYNNIIDPNSDKAPVTIDTHAGAAAMLKPFAANDTEIAKHTFGGVSDKKTGAIGTYAALTEAYRLAAKEVGVLPREMQSITWEAVRGLFTDVFKGGKTQVGEKEVIDAKGAKKIEPIFEKNKFIIKKIWEDVKNGKLTIDEARTKIEQFAEGIDEPSWTRPGSESTQVERATPDARELLGSSIVGVDTGEGRGVGGIGEAEMVQSTTEGIKKPETFFSRETPEEKELPLQPKQKENESEQLGRSEQAGDRGGRYTSGSLAPLESAPTIKGATGPDANLVSAAEKYARENGIPLRRQGEYAKVDEDRAVRIADAYENMKHDPTNPKVKAAYDDLIRQTKDQYQALIDSGYEFTFFDEKTDPYESNPYNAMRDLRQNKKMAVYGTYDGFGTEGITATELESNPMLQDTGLKWKDQNGIEHPVTANDLFRAVHDAFGHGLEGSGFRARGEENAWQAHVRLFTGDAIAAMTTETRGQNSWLNYGKYGEKNRTAKVQDTVFAEQKTGLMPEWTWTEGRVGDMPEQETVKKNTASDLLNQYEKGTIINSKEIAEKGKSSDNIINKVFELFSDKFKTIKISGKRPNEGAAFYDKSNKQIDINKNSSHWQSVEAESLIDSLAHEHTHHLLQESANNQKIESELDEIKNDLINNRPENMTDAESSIFNFMTAEKNSPQEILTYAVSNPEIRKFLTPYAEKLNKISNEIIGEDIITKDTGALFSRGEEGKSELQKFVEEERAAGTSDADIRATLEEFAQDPKANLDAAKIDELMAAPKVEEAEVTPEPTPKPKTGKKVVVKETEHPFLYEGSDQRRISGIMNHIKDAKNISKKTKEGFKLQGVTYAVANNAEARVVAKDIIKAFGKEDALFIAKDFDLHPSVRSAVFAELIDNAYREGKKAKTKEDKLSAANEWRDLVNSYGKRLTESGQFSAYAGHFYKTSPLGFVMVENDKTQKRFEEFESDKVQSFDKLWEQINKTETGRLKIQEEVEKLRKAERVTERKKNTKNIDDFFNKMKDKGSMGYDDAGTYFSREQAQQNPSSKIPKDVWDSAMDTMKTSVKDGDSVADAVQKAIDIISESIGDKWNKEKFKSDYQELVSRVADGNAKEKPTVDLVEKRIKDLEKQIEAYKQKIAQGGVPGEKKAEKFADVEEINKLKEERDNLRKENEKLLKDAQKGKYEPSEIEAKRAKRIKERIDELNRRIAENDFSAEQYKAKKEKDALDIELENAKKLYDQAKKQSPEYIKKKAEQFIEQFKEKIEGVSEEKKAEMVRRAIKKIIDSGGLEKDEFKEIVADVMGFKKLTDAQAAEIEDLNEKINTVSDLEDAMINDPTPENIAAYEAGRIEGMDAAMKIFNMTHKEADITGTLKSLVSGGLLGIPTLIMNVGQNVVTNATIRLPKAVIKQMGDLGIYGVSALLNQFKNTKIFFSPSDLIKAQEGYFKMGKKGLELGAVNFMKGTQMRDYLSETSYQSNLAPKKAMEDLRLWRAGEKFLTKAEVIDKLIKSSIISKQANFILKGMGFGDLPFRWAAEGATAIQIATKELKLSDSNEIEAFMLSPQKYAYKVFIKNGDAADVAAQKSEEIKERILNEGKKAVFEEDNLLTMINSSIENLLKSKGETGITAKIVKPVASVLKTTQFPFLKIPSNIAWQYFKIMNPELSFSYGAGQLAISAYYSKKGNIKEARAYYERAKDSFATGVLGLGVALAASSIISSGLVRSSNDEDNKIRETTGERAYGRQNQLNYGKLIGGGNYWIDLKWFGALGSMLNTKAKIAEAQLDKKIKGDTTLANNFVDNLGYASTSAMNGLVFDQGSKIVDAIKKKDAVNSWLASQANTLENVFFGATFAAISKAALPEEARSKGEGVLDEINNNMKARNIFYRWAAGYPPSRISIWGEPISKDNSLKGILSSMFGFQDDSSDLFGAILYDEARRTGDARFFPMPEDNKITVNDKEVEITQKEKDELDTYIGKYRKALVASFVYDFGEIDLSQGFIKRPETAEDQLKYDDKKYSELNDAEKIEALKYLYDAAREAGFNQFIEAHQDNPVYKIAELDMDKKMAEKYKQINAKFFKKDIEGVLDQAPKSIRKKFGGS